MRSLSRDLSSLPPTPAQSCKKLSENLCEKKMLISPRPCDLIERPMYRLHSFRRQKVIQLEVKPLLSTSDTSIATFSAHLNTWYKVSPVKLSAWLGWKNRMNRGKSREHVQSKCWTAVYPMIRHALPVSRHLRFYVTHYVLSELLLRGSCSRQILPFTHSLTLTRSI